MNVEFSSSQVLADFTLIEKKSKTSSYVDFNIFVKTKHIFELFWILSKLKVGNDKNLLRFNDMIPSWCSFHEIISKANYPVTNIGFSPLIPREPTSHYVYLLL